MNQNNELNKTLTISQAIALAITIVVGSGLLLLPGLAYQQAGASSIYVWLICALLVIPLLIIFSYLGVKYPTAGGVAGFMQYAFSRNIASAVEVMLIGTFGLGIPAIALTGSYYLNYLLGQSLHTNNITFIIAFLLLLVAFMVNYLGAKISGNIQKYLAIVLVVVLILIPSLSLVFSSEYQGVGIAPIDQIDFKKVIALLGMVFFAFTGWEMLSFTIEEYQNPKKDYPIAVALSFLIVVALYLLLVVAIQTIIDSNNPLINKAPLLILSENIFGEIAKIIMVFLSLIIIVANLIGAVWAASRLVFASARAGLLPIAIAKLNKNGIPRTAITLSCLFFIIILILNYYNLLTVNDLLRLAGQNFFIIYGMAVLAYIKIAQNIFRKIFGISCLIMTLAIMGTFGIELLYPILLISLGYYLNKLQ